MQTETAEYYHLDLDDGLTMNMRVNPLFQFGLDETREELCTNILNDISGTVDFFSFFGKLFLSTLPRVFTLNDSVEATTL